ncbi:hypothetical protein [Photobacterium kishitanii]|uniref:Uncharacterized protein n=1 Tax=Photobacterium kishitanii TaxID=318456 RepID=A0A2T3KMD3_9GAMM|nr:hypothetical protein [Photobacterium kishitanii]PSV00959.1 hypothetical protein C9J27_02735 [Photobacterium kishitanii]
MLKKQHQTSAINTNDMLHIQCLAWYDGELESIYFNKADKKYYLLFVIDFVPSKVNTVESYIRHCKDESTDENEDKELCVFIYAESELDKLIDIEQNRLSTREVILESKNVWLTIGCEQPVLIDVQSIESSIPSITDEPTSVHFDNATCHCIRFNLSENTPIDNLFVLDENISCIYVDDKHTAITSPMTTTPINYGDLGKIIDMSNEKMNEFNFQIHFQNIRHSDTFKRIVYAANYSYLDNIISNLSNNDHDLKLKENLKSKISCIVDNWFK